MLEVNNFSDKFSRLIWEITTLKHYSSQKKMQISQRSFANHLHGQVSQSDNADISIIMQITKSAVLAVLYYRGLHSTSKSAGFCVKSF